MTKNKDVIIHTPNTQVTIKPKAQRYLHAATSNNTRRAYQQDIKQFILSGGVLPASAKALLQYLEAKATSLNPRTLSRRLTAIKQWHLAQGFSDPTANLTVKKMMKGILHVHGKPKNKALPLTIFELKKITDLLADSKKIIDIRNMALIHIGFFGAFRRSELVAIQYEHIQFEEQGLRILIPKSKTDQTGSGLICAIPFGNKILCPVGSLKLWLNISGIKQGYIFRQVLKNNRITETGIKENQVNIILKEMAKNAGFDNSLSYSSHSLRRGFATAASLKGATLQAIMRQGRWKHVATALGYMEDAKVFEDNAAGIVLK